MKKHIFLIDDDYDDLTIFNEALKAIPGSYKCTYVDNAEEGIEILRYLTPDYIIADYNMPGMNGLDFFSKIGKEERLHDVPFFIYSSLLTIDIKRKASEIGIVGCLNKPDTMTSMIEMLHGILAYEELRHSV